MALAKSYMKCKDHNDENGVLEADHGLVTRQTCWMVWFKVNTVVDVGF